MLGLAVIRAQVINGLRSASANGVGRWYDMADLLIPYYVIFGGAFLALALLTALLWLVRRRARSA